MTPSSSVNSSLSGYSADEAPSRVDRFSGRRRPSFFDGDDEGEDVLDAIARKEVKRQPSSAVIRRPLDRELGRAAASDGEEDEHGWIDSNTDLIKPGALRSGPPDERAYEELDRAISELPIAYADDSPVKPSPRRAAVGSIGWAAEDEAADPWASPREIESADAVREREAAEARNERRRRRIRKLAKLVRENEIDADAVDLQQHFRSSTTSSNATIVLSTGQILRRGRALRRLGMDTDSEVDPAPHPDYSEDERGEADDDDYHAVVPRDHDYALQGERGTDWWPVTVAARIHPRTVALRASVAANFALVYARFLFVLFVALLGAIWQVRCSCLRPR